MNARAAPAPVRPDVSGSRPDDANPFATRYIRPGAAEFLFPAGTSATSLVDSLGQNGWRGQIVGPHGTGKSTLLAILLPHCAAAGRNVVSVQLHEGQRTLPFSAAERKTWNTHTLVVIDGYEQLSWWSRWQLKAAVKKTGCGLLVTSHADAGLPELWRSTVSPELACAVVARLQATFPPLVEPTDVRGALREKRGNFREALFALYDIYEIRRRREIVKNI